MIDIDRLDAIVRTYDRRLLARVAQDALWPWWFHEAFYKDVRRRYAEG